VERLLTGQRIVPVLRLENAASAVPLADALRRGGIQCVEVTLRTPAALDVIRRMAALDGFVVAAGTVLNADDAMRSRRRERASS
jgi:2-dehydro-3-deoxyphosphogluconate aldolase/(4S)-4-hydroxy-2-oxoglutarate aldolase